MPKEEALVAIQKIREACDELEASYADEGMPPTEGQETPAPTEAPTPPPAALIPGFPDKRQGNY